MELIASQPGFKYVDEPLHPENLFLAGLTDSKDDSAWESLMPNPNRAPQLRQYIQNIEQNRIHIGEPKFLSKFYRFLTNRIVYKILRCKDLIPWFQSTFNLQVVYLVRHPLACSVSRKQFPRLKLFLENQEYSTDYLTPTQVEYAHKIIGEEDPLQIAVLDWCIQNAPALKLAENGNCEIVNYESLVQSPQPQIERLAELFSLSYPEKMYDNIRRASASTVQSDQHTQNAFAKKNQDLNNLFLLGKWRQQVSSAQEAKAFEVLDAFNVGMYRIGSDVPIQSV